MTKWKRWYITGTKNNCIFNVDRQNVVYLQWQKKNIYALL